MSSTLQPNLSPRLGPGARLTAESGRTVHVLTWRGEGSYARVYRGALEDLGGRRGDCAVKIAKGEIPGAEARLLREREVLAAVRHPRLVRLLDTGTEVGRPWMALEWLDGETLFDLLAPRKRLPLRGSLEHLEAVLEGLAAVHAAGRVHGDLRPQNLIVTPGRGAVLTDPGAEPEAAEADDLHAAGALLHRMLTGAEPGREPVLTPSAGYNRAAVSLWERLSAPEPPSARDLLAEVQTLRRSL